MDSKKILRRISHILMSMDLPIRDKGILLNVFVYLFKSLNSNSDTTASDDNADTIKSLATTIDETEQSLINLKSLVVENMDAIDTLKKDMSKKFSEVSKKITNLKKSATK